MSDKTVKVGLGVMLLKEGKVLFGKRNDDPEKASSELHGEGTWTMPGGKLHFGESFEELAIREVKEETGLIIKQKDLKLISVQNDRSVPEVQFITLGFLCEMFEGEAQTMEPEEITEWKWFALDDLPVNIFPPSKKVIENYLAGRIY